jgi:diphthine synthase
MVDFGTPLHCLVIVGNGYPVEEEMLDFYKLKRTEFGKKVIMGTV